jgi:hypothetical protein
MLLVGANHPLMIASVGRKLARKPPKFSFGEQFAAACGKYFQRNYLQLGNNRPLQLRISPTDLRSDVGLAFQPDAPQPVRLESLTYESRIWRADPPPTNS